MSRRWALGTPGDDYGDLAEAVERGGVSGDGSLEPAPGELRDRYTIALDSLASMIADLLGQIVDDAGSLRRARAELRIPAELQAAWTRREPLAGLDATAVWLASRPARGPIVLVPSFRARRGDAYGDLAELSGRSPSRAMARSTRLACDGATRSSARRGCAWSAISSRSWSATPARSSALRRCSRCRSTA